MPITDFFKIRFPRSVTEGAVKGVTVGFLVNATYDGFFNYFVSSSISSEMVQSPEGQQQMQVHSTRVMNSYAFFVMGGMVLGFIGSFLTSEEEELNLGEPLVTMPAEVKLSQTVREGGWPIQDPITFEEIKEHDQIVLIKEEKNIWVPYLKSTFDEQYRNTRKAPHSFKDFNNVAKSIKKDVLVVTGLAIKQKIQGEERRVAFR